MAHSIYVFDAYGTLFDVHAAVRRHAAEVGRMRRSFRRCGAPNSWSILGSSRSWAGIATSGP